MPKTLTITFEAVSEEVLKTVKRNFEKRSGEFTSRGIRLVMSEIGERTARQTIDGVVEAVDPIDRLFRGSGGL